MVYYSALHWAKKAEKSAEKCEQIQEDLRDSGLDLSDYAKKGEVVHNTGDETIDGVKTFNNGVYFNSAVAFVKNTTNTVATYQDVNYIRDNALETNNIPYDKTYYTNALMDKNNKFVTYIQNTHKTDGTSSISINARTQNANGDNVTGSIGVEATKNGDVVATAPIPTASSSMDSKRIATLGWVNDPTKSTNVVHRTGNETIDGIKKFTNALYLSIGGFREIIDIDKGTAPTSGIYAFDSIFYDKNGTLQKHKIAQKYTYIQKNGAVANITSVFKPEAGSEEVVSMGIGYNEKGEGYSTTVMPVAFSSTTATNIATVGWVNDPSASLNVVHRTGDESFSGNKTMLGSRFIFGATNLGSYKEIEARSEKGNTRLGVLRFTNGSDGVTRAVEISAVDNTNSYRGGLKVGINSSGETYVTAPTPPAGDNSTQIATTAWVNTTLTTAISEFVKGGSNYIKIPVEGKTNPLIIQWGYVADGEKTSTITFPTPFTADNFCLTSQAYWDNSGFTVSSYEHTKTSFTYVRSRGDVSFRWIAVGY